MFGSKILLESPPVVSVAREISLATETTGIMTELLEMTAKPLPNLHARLALKYCHKKLRSLNSLIATLNA